MIPVAESPPPVEPATAAPSGRRIGNIRLVRLLGKGGMGEVYLGIDEVLEREVAVKVIPPALLNPQRRARLQREARILSHLAHPGICAVYDYLRDEAGDCLVLELVRGRSLEQAKMDGLAGRDLLDVAIQVAEVLAAVHSRGILHRDLKPANVMLTAERQVRVLDFGLAQPLVPSPSADGLPMPVAAEDEPLPAGAPAGGGSGQDTALLTQAGRVLGTLHYMSPEQARGEPLTAASDLYSFGLLLQYLVTGRGPYDGVLPLPEMLVRVQDGDTRPVGGGDRELAALIEQLKAVSPEARPTAAQALSRLEWLRDRPKRRLRRFAAAAAVAAAVLALGLHVAELRRERNAAVAARIEAEGARRDVERARAESEQLVDFLLGLFEVSDPGTARGQTITARELLDRGAGRARESLTDQPLVQARMLETIGRIDYQLGLYPTSRELLEESLALRERHLGGGHPEVAESLHSLATLHRELGLDAVPLFERALAIREESLGPDHPDVAATVNNLGIVHATAGRFDQALPLFERALAIREGNLGPEHPDVAASLNNVAGIHLRRGEIEQAETLLLRALAIREAALPADHPDLAANLAALGALYGDAGRNAEAEPYHRRALVIWERTLGPDHPRLALVLSNLGRACLAQGRYAEADEMFLRALEVRERALGPDHPDLGGILVSRATLLRETGRDEEAARELERVLRLWEPALPADAPELLQVRKDHAELVRGLSGVEPAAQATGRH